MQISKNVTHDDSKDPPIDRIHSTSLDLDLVTVHAQAPSLIRSKPSELNETYGL